MFTVSKQDGNHLDDLKFSDKIRIDICPWYQQSGKPSSQANRPGRHLYLTIIRRTKSEYHRIKMEASLSFWKSLPWGEVNKTIEYQDPKGFHWSEQSSGEKV